MRRALSAQRVWRRCSRWRDVNARVVLLGDTRQLASVEAGPRYGSLRDRQGGGGGSDGDPLRSAAATYRDAMKRFAAGKAGEGLDKLDAMGRVRTDAGMG